MDVGIFSNPIQGLCKLNGISKLSPPPHPLQPLAFPIQLGDNNPMTSSKKTCTPGSQGQDLFLSSLFPIAGWRSGTQLLQACWKRIRESGGLLGVGCCLLRITSMSLGHRPLALAICGRRGLENRLPKPQRKG